MYQIWKNIRKNKSNSNQNIPNFFFQKNSALIENTRPETLSWNFRNGFGNFCHAAMISATVSSILATQAFNFGYGFHKAVQNVWPRNKHFWPRTHFSYILATRAFCLDKMQFLCGAGRNHNFRNILGWSNLCKRGQN